MKILIPAKGTSMRVPRKNVQPFWGRPLVHSTIAKCQRWFPRADVYVATDDAEIHRIAEELNCQFHDLTPADSTDRRTALELFQEFLNRWPVSECCLCIHVTSPFTFRHEIEAAVQNPAPYLCSGYVGVFHMLSDGYSLSQSIPQRVIATGNFVKTYGSMTIPAPSDIAEHHFAPVSWISAMDINTPEELALAQWIARRVRPEDFD